MVQETLCHVSPYVDASLPHLLPVMDEGSSCAMVQPPRGLQGILRQVQDRKIDPLQARSERCDNESVSSPDLC